MTVEHECPKCGTVAVNRDFCSCGEYLGWNHTRDAPVSETFRETEPAEPAAAPEPSGYRPPAPPPPRAATLLTLRDPARTDDPGTAVSVAVVPGEDVIVLATVRNQGQIVDTFDVRVDGLPDGWWTVSSPTIFLNPWGASGDYEQEVQVRLHPPKAPESQARAWPFTVMVRSRTLAADVAFVTATLTVHPFASTAMRVTPARRAGRRSASFDVALENHGNTPIEIAVSARDTEADCPVSIDPERSTVPVGQSAAAVLNVGVPKPLIFGRPVDHYFDVTHRTPGEPSEPLPQRVTLRQKPWFPWWVPPVAALAVALLLALRLIGKEDEEVPVAAAIKVPNLENMTEAEAKQKLTASNLAYGGTNFKNVTTEDSLGTVVLQVPVPSEEAKADDKVRITIARSAEKARVPTLTTFTVAKASDRLDDSNFGVDVQPADAGDDWVVARQTPAARKLTFLGSSVTLFAKKPEEHGSASPTPTDTPTDTPDGTPTEPPKPKDTTRPAVSLTGVDAGATYKLGSVPAARCITKDKGSGVAKQAQLSVSERPVGPVTLTCSGATDKAGNRGRTIKVAYLVRWPSDGLEPPIDTDAAFNVVKAGSTVPLKFSLKGDRGLEIVAPDPPPSTDIECDSDASPNRIDETAPESDNALSYDADADQYTYAWETDETWADTCRELTLSLTDGSISTARFKFTG